MSVRQVRNHIPISRPARREPLDGAETPMRVPLGFEPASYRQRCSVDLSDRWLTDPRYRHRTLVAMKQELQCTFPRLSTAVTAPCRAAIADVQAHAPHGRIQDLVASNRALEERRD